MRLQWTMVLVTTAVSGLTKRGYVPNRRPKLASALGVDRGGAKIEEEKKEPSALARALGSLPPGVRVHVVGVAVTTLLAMSGAFEPDAVFSLDMPSTLLRLQLWRPATALCFLGKPSMTSATSLYLLHKYGIELETEVGSAAYAKFLILQCVLLIGVGSAIGLPFVANSLVTAIIYAASRLHPMADIQFQFGIKLKYYMLPFGLMVIEMLQAQSVAAVIPHAVGCLTAHFHHFFAVVWPQIQRDLNGGPPSRKLSKLDSPATRTASRLARPGRKLIIDDDDDDDYEDEDD